jgi:hypothetical protein
LRREEDDYFDDDDWDVLWVKYKDQILL